MRRTQIYLTKSQQMLLRDRAQKYSTTVSEVVRDLIDQGLKQKNKTKPKKHESLFEAAQRISRLGANGPKDLAINHDEYLYGKKSDFR